MNLNEIVEKKSNTVQPLVSVIIPVFNVSKYLRECLDSVVNQTYECLEIIIIDDGSTDDSGQICDEYAKLDVRIHVIHQVNGGLGHARNVGMSMATGKYLIFLDSDDYLDLNAISFLVNEAEKNQTDIIFFSSLAFYDGCPPENMPNQSVTYLIQNNHVKSGIESIIIAKESGEFSTGICRRFFDRIFLESCEVFFPESCIHEDEFFCFITYYKAKRVETIANAFYYRRCRSGSIMSSKSLFASTVGYCNALTLMLNCFGPAFSKLFTSSSSSEIIINQIIYYIDKITINYRSALIPIRKQSYNDALQISKYAQPILKRCSFIFNSLSRSQRVSIYSLFLGCLFSVISYHFRFSGNNR